MNTQGLNEHPTLPKASLNKLIPLMVRQAHHERKQRLTVHPELVEGLNQSFPKWNRSDQTIKLIFIVSINDTSL